MAHEDENGFLRRRRRLRKARRAKTGLRALGRNPRALGINPRTLGDMTDEERTAHIAEIKKQIRVLRQLSPK
jgi:hypothetical protein